MRMNQKMLALGSKRSVIREIFEYSKMRKKEIGDENVYDFSLGNPSVPAPDEVDVALLELVAAEDSVALHGYTSAQGDFYVRKTVSDSINKRFGTSLTPNNIYMTCGAAASLSISLKAIVNDGDECIVFAPFFTEYRVFIENAGASVVVSMPRDVTFQIDIEDFKNKITPSTKAVIINSPNNPSGVVYSEDTVSAVCKILEEKENEYGHAIYLIADEPYRELVYSGVNVPYLMNYYKNTIVCYSYSKSLSLPGERIGYIAVSSNAEGSEELYLAICGAGRSLGYVCAPSLFQRVVAKCIDTKVNVCAYEQNRNLLYDALERFGYSCVRPDGAFYLFVKSPSGDAYEFFERAKKHEILIVPCDDFGVDGYVRIAYCVSRETIEGALSGFEKIAEEYDLKGN